LTGTDPYPILPHGLFLSEYRAATQISNYSTHAAALNGLKDQVCLQFPATPLSQDYHPADSPEVFLRSHIRIRSHPEEPLPEGSVPVSQFLLLSLHSALHWEH